jgi:hypothetical protein
MGGLMKILFKEEDEINGESVGPVHLCTDEGTPLGQPQAFREGAKPRPWVTQAEAEKIAKALALELA